MIELVAISALCTSILNTISIAVLGWFGRKYLESQWRK